MDHGLNFVWATSFDPEGKRLVIRRKRLGLDLGCGDRHKEGRGRSVISTRSTLRAFSPDGRLFATGCGDGTISVWDPSILDTRSAMLLHPERCNIIGVAFRNDGHQLLTAGGDGVAQLWDPGEGRRLGGPCLHPRPLRCAAMDRRGRWILTGGRGWRGTGLGDAGERITPATR